MSDAENNAGGNEGGNQGAVEFPQWMSSLPDAHKNNERFATFKEPSEFWNKADALLQAEGQSIVIPGKDAKPEEVAEFYAKIGRPESADGYNITKPADLPEGVLYEPGGEQLFKQKAFEFGLTQEQAEKQWNWYWGELVKNGSAIDAQKKAEATAEAGRVREEAVGKLKTEWGAKFTENVSIAVTEGFKKFAKNDPAATDFIEKATYEGVPIGDHPVFIKLFYEIGKATMSDTTGGRGGVGAESGDPDAKTAREMFPSMNKK